MKKNNNDNNFLFQIFSKMVIIVSAFWVIAYIIFALVPEYTGFSFPTGGWDWLSFIGNLVGIVIASWGVVFTIESSNKSAIDETSKAVRPILNTSIINNYKVPTSLNLNGIYIPYSVSDKMIKFDENFYFLSNISYNFNDPLVSLLQIRNIGLGSAMDVHIKIYKIEKISEQDPAKHNINNLEELYNSIKVNDKARSFTYNSNKDEGSNYISSDVYFEIQPFHLNNNTETFNILLGQRDFSGEAAFYLFDITYSDMYGEKKYQQYQHVCFTKEHCNYVLISSQKCLTTKNEENKK